MDILMLINTTGLQYDDRLRKECLTLSRMGRKPYVVALENANKPAAGFTEYGVKYRTIHLASRSLFPRSKGLAIKAAELNLRFVLAVVRGRPTVVWIHNMMLIGLIPLFVVFKRLGWIKTIVWDQHEMPSNKWLNQSAMRKILLWIMSLCDTVIVANVSRRELLTDIIGAERLRSVQFAVLENFADKEFAQIPVRDLPPDVMTFLRGRPYFLIQGGANPGRFLAEVVEATVRADTLPSIVVGPYSEDQLRTLQDQWGPRMSDYVYFTGPIPQYDIAKFIDGATASVVLYSTDVLNWRLCAPNRLYQAIARGTPVIVGNNPPMAQFVKESGAGIVLESDGRSADDLVKVFTKYETLQDLRPQVATVKRRYVWESQDQEIAAIMAEAD